MVVLCQGCFLKLNSLGKLKTSVLAVPSLCRVIERRSWKTGCRNPHKNTHSWCVVLGVSMASCSRMFFSLSVLVSGLPGCFLFLKEALLQPLIPSPLICWIFHGSIHGIEYLLLLKLSHGGVSLLPGSLLAFFSEQITVPLEGEFRWIKYSLSKFEYFPLNV